MDNITDFKEGDTIQSVYSGLSYKVVSKDKHGMAVLFNLKTERTETWNAYNNRHFTKLKGQLNLFER